MQLLIILFYKNYTDKDGNKKCHVCFGNPSDCNQEGEFGYRPTLNGNFKGHFSFDVLDTVYKCAVATYEGKAYVQRVIEAV